MTPKILISFRFQIMWKPMPTGFPCLDAHTRVGQETMWRWGQGYVWSPFHVDDM